MNTIVIKRGINQIVANMTVGKPLCLLILVSLLAYERTRDVVLVSLVDAYFQVSIFVAATLIGLFFFERVNRRSVEQILLRNQRWQVPIAAFLGALPGCGGAIVAVTQYTRGALSFGGVVAVLTATMGDAAFLLLAKEPLAALAVFAICAPTGVVFGYLVDWIHGRDFLKVNADDYDDNEEIEENPLLSPFYRLWMLLFVPGAVIALAVAAQVDVATVFAIGGLIG